MDKTQHSDVSRLHPAIRIATWLVFVASLVTLVVHVSRESEFEVRMNWFQGDSLFPAHLAKDVLIDGGDLGQWRSPPAPFVFPDWIVVGAVMYLTGNALIANLVFAAFVMTTFVLATVGCNRLIGGRSVQHREAWLVLAVSLLVLSCVARASFMTRFLFLPAYHAGTCAAAVVAAYLFMRLQRYGTDGWPNRIGIAALIAVCFLLGLSDLLTVCYVALPLTAASLIAWYIAKVPLRRLAGGLAAVWLATIAGAKATDAVLLRENPDSFSAITLEHLEASLRVAVREAFKHVQALEVTHLAGFALTGLAMIALGIAWSRRKRAWEAGGQQACLYIAYNVFAMWAIICGVVLGCSNTLWANNDYLFATHYFLPSIYAPFLTLPLLLDFFARRVSTNKLRYITLSATVMVAAAAGYLMFDRLQKPASISLVAYRPAFVPELDQIARKHDLKCGYSDYWDARQVGIYSQQGVKMLPVYGDPLTFFYWMTNRQWATPANEQQPSPVEFVMVGGEHPTAFTVESLRRWLGEPTAIEPLGDQNDPYRRQVLIYKHNPGEEGIETLISGAIPSLNRAGGEMTLGFERFGGQVGYIHEGRKIAEAPRDAAGYLLFGPYLKLRPGEYEVRMDCQVGDVQPEGTYWDVGCVDTSDNSFVRFAEGKIDCDTKGVDACFTIPEQLADAAIEFRVHFGGQGRVSVGPINLKRATGHDELAANY